MTSNPSRPLLHFYFDDSGTRHPDRKEPTSTVGDWFALGGVLVTEPDDRIIRNSHSKFCGKWGIDYPLHSIKIRHKTGDFSWLATATQNKLREFHNDLGSLILDAPLIAHACVIDRPGYRARYEERYGRQQWSLCKTAFGVLAERIAKFAEKKDHRVKLFAEKTDRKSDEKLREYFKDLREKGSPFPAANSSQYSPLTAEKLKFRLLDLGFKTKNCPLTQFADLCLYPVCRSKYDSFYAPYRQLHDKRKLIESHLAANEIPTMGLKFSCFDG